MNTLAAMNTLVDLGKMHSAAKSEALLNAYDALFTDVRRSAWRVLEFGTGFGGSLLMWAEYFEYAKILGVDIEPLKIPDHPRVSVIQGLQEEFVPKHTFDVIIDDGAHTRVETEAALQHCWSSLRSGGFYCIEDWGTGYWPSWSDGRAWKLGHQAGMVGLVKDFVDAAGADDVRKENETGPGSFVVCHLASLQVFPGLAVLRKS